MPIYEYTCESCGAPSEFFLRSGDEEPKECSKCGGILRKIISASGFQFKGTGWYVTDYARKGKMEGAGESGKSSSSISEASASSAVPAPSTAGSSQPSTSTGAAAPVSSEKKEK